VRRRDFVSLLGGAATAWPLAARAQQQPKMLRVGFVGMQPRSPLYANFLKRMAELGYQEGRNFTFDYIQTQNIEVYEIGYRELAARKIDIFYAAQARAKARACSPGKVPWADVTSSRVCLPPSSSINESSHCASGGLIVTVRRSRKSVIRNWPYWRPSC
jgi:hypothetical protein